MLQSTFSSTTKVTTTVSPYDSHCHPIQQLFSVQLFFCDGTDGGADVADAVVAAEAATVEVEAARAVAVERTRPVVAVRAVIGEAALVATARSREKDTIAVLLACHFIAIDS